MVEVLELNKSLILYSDSTFVLRLRLLQDLFFVSLSLVKLQVLGSAV